MNNSVLLQLVQNRKKTLTGLDSLVGATGFSKRENTQPAVQIASITLISANLHRESLQTGGGSGSLYLSS